MAYAAKDVIGTHPWIDHSSKVREKSLKAGREWSQMPDCLSKEQKCVVTTCTVVGGVIGGLAGSAAGGLGAVPGAAIGATGGFFIGLALVGAEAECTKKTKNMV